ncbi:erythropoietin receptor [Alligator mississippiensis]|uniref:erythropoietin receptor n=1 Tax=Alligator mississippiensis TaxID=8496 RepID=UPI0028777849|nr:erythropoietin receptor [Alligator mississippiensis]
MAPTAAALGFLLLCAAGASWDPGGFEREAALLLAEESRDPKCFTRLQDDLTCFWETRDNLESQPELSPGGYELEYRLEDEAWRSCNLSAARAPGNRTLLSCAFPALYTPAFTPLQLRVLRDGSLLYNRTIQVDQVVLLEPPSNLSVRPTETRGQVCVSCQPPRNRYLEPSLCYQLSFAAPGATAQMVQFPANGPKCLSLAMRGHTRYTFAIRVKPDGVSYKGYWSAWSEPVSLVTPSDLDPLVLTLSLIVVFLTLLMVFVTPLCNCSSPSRFLKNKIWPVIPSPERSFDELFSVYKGNFQLWVGQNSSYLRQNQNANNAEEKLVPLEILSKASDPPDIPYPPPNILPAPTEDYLVLDEQLVPRSPSQDMALPPDLEGQLNPSGVTHLAQVSPSSSFEYTRFDPHSAQLQPCPPSPSAHRALKYSYLLLSNFDISSKASRTSSSLPSLYSNLTSPPLPS